MQDVKTLTLTPNTTKTPPSADSKTDVAQFVCPMNLKEMNGSQPFVYLWTCGCVFSQAGLRAVSSTPPPQDDAGKLSDGKDTEEASPGKQLDVCPQCAKKYDKARDVILLNPPADEEERMFTAMLARRAAEPVKTKGKKRKAGTPPDAGAEPASKKRISPVPLINSSVATASRKVANELAAEEAKRKSQMSDAVKSLYVQKGAQRKETFMTMGTFTRVR